MKTMNMFKHKKTKTLVVMSLSLSLLMSGCRTQPRQAHYLGEADDSFYKGITSEISYPVVSTEMSPTVEETFSPRTLESREKDAVWDVSLEECLQIGLAKSEIIKSAGQFLNPSNQLYTAGEQVSSVYDPAIQDSGVLFGGLGTEAALSNFDVNWTTSMFWGRNETIQNNLFNGVPAGTLSNNSAAFSTGLSKQLAQGGSINVTHDWDYLNTNNNAALFGTSYTGNLTASVRQPLLAGAGADFVRVAGPSTPGFGRITGVSQGLLIARINNDISITNFEANIRDLLKDIEDTYWDLYLSYRNYDTARKAQAFSLKTWRNLDAIKKAGGKNNFGNFQEPQARDRYYETEAQAKSALSNLYSTEQRLRNLIHLPVNDGRVMRPANEPMTVKLEPDWTYSLTEALTERVELRRQKWLIKSLQLQLDAAHNLNRPRLDVVGSYNVNGFGQRLLNGENDDDTLGTAQGVGSAYETMTQGDQTGWSGGVELSVPIGQRLAKTQVRNIELRLSKAQKVLQNQEEEIAQELAVAFQEVVRTYNTAVSNFNRREAASERMMILNEIRLGETNTEGGGDSIDLLLRAQESLAASENAYFASLVEYNKAVLDLQYRKGTLLAHNNVHLMEGTWHAKAYQDALERSYARSHALMLANPGHASPADFASSQPVMQPLSFRMREATENTVPGKAETPLQTETTRIWMNTPPSAPAPEEATATGDQSTTTK